MRKKGDSSDASSGTWADGTLPGDGRFPAREALRKVLCSVSLSQAQFELHLMRTPSTWEGCSGAYILGQCIPWYWAAWWPGDVQLDSGIRSPGR